MPRFTPPEWQRVRPLRVRLPDDCGDAERYVNDLMRELSDQFAMSIEFGDVELDEGQEVATVDGVGLIGDRAFVVQKRSVPRKRRMYERDFSGFRSQDVPDMLSLNIHAWLSRKNPHSLAVREKLAAVLEERGCELLSV